MAIEVVVPGMTPQELQSLKEQLEKEAGEIEAQLGAEKKTPEYGSDTEGMMFDEEADEAEELGKQLGVHQELKLRLDQIEKALEKINHGQYGKCEQCGKDIPLELLRVNPESELCKECKA